MSRPTARDKLAEKLGAPAPGMAWCTGHKREPHQVPLDDFAPRGGRCKACRSVYYRDWYSDGGRHTVRPSTRVYETGAKEPDVRPIEPGRHPPNNDGKLDMPSWGYLGAGHGLYHVHDDPSRRPLSRYD